MTRVKIIRSKDAEVNKTFEPPIRAGMGILSSTVGEPIKMTMGRAVLPPGGRNQRHYHSKTDAGMYVLKGRFKYFLGPDHEMEEVIAEEGDFVFVPQGEIHGFMNLSDTETAEVISTYDEVGTLEESGTIFVEPVWK
jgi:quercetin dioxygenase-like cupin family protein